MIIKKTSSTRESKLNDILSHTNIDKECMIWKGCFNTDGYARMTGNIKVHRLVYELTHNIDISGLVIRHTCDNPQCINPKHLLKGTPYDNAQDRVERGRNYRVITKDIITHVMLLLGKHDMSQKDIAAQLGINPRRVSDIHCGKYCSATGKFLGHG